MERQARKFRLKSHIMGGGLALHEGEIVDEMQLKGYADWLRREGTIEEVSESHGMNKSGRKAHTR